MTAGHTLIASATGGTTPPYCLYAFDLIELNGDDLRREPLEVRNAGGVQGAWAEGEIVAVSSDLRHIGAPRNDINVDRGAAPPATPLEKEYGKWQRKPNNAFCRTRTTR
jgi:hypothetical protein